MRIKIKLNSYNWYLEKIYTWMTFFSSTFNLYFTSELWWNICGVFLWMITEKSWDTSKTNDVSSLEIRNSGNNELGVLDVLGSCIEWCLPSIYGA